MFTNLEIHGNPYASTVWGCFSVATMQDLCGRYRVGTSAMADYIKRHIDEINRDGDHARLARGCWLFDETAVQRLDELRGFGVAGVIEAVENKEIKELKVLTSNLQAALLHAQQQAVDALQRVADSERERRLLVEHQQNQAAELATLRERNTAQQRDIERMAVDLMRANREAERLQDVQTRMMRASLWQRITGHW